MGVPRHFPILWLNGGLLNEGAQGHFFNLKEVPTTRLPNVKMLLRWSSRMHICCFVEIALYLSLYHPLVIDMVIAIGHGIPAPIDAIDVCVSKHQSALIGGDGDSNAIERR